MSVELAAVVSYLDEYLRVAEIEDYPNALNGLQVENGGTVNKIAVAVDACEATIERAAESEADLLVVHHGLFWGGLQPLTGPHGRRIRKLIGSGTALYAAHLPLDVHPEVGNNVVLARMLEVDLTGWFGEIRGRPIGVSGQLSVSLGELEARVSRALDVVPRVIPAGPREVARIGILTGGGGDLIRAAHEAGLDTYVTGEGTHHTYFAAEEWGVNVVYAGHYATETVGVRALGRRLAQEFGLQWEFIDHPTGM